MVIGVEASTNLSLRPPSKTSSPVPFSTSLATAVGGGAGGGTRNLP
uniref:Uncharacterized protein n=1 Tax=Arundo donax TaxID=35708 RepID=A0A0A9C4P8_ARUDO